MLKARFSNGAAFLGLSAQNITRLQAGSPIKLNLADIGRPAQEIIIACGPTERMILADLHAQGWIDGRTTFLREP